MVRNRCSIFCQLTSVEHQATCSSLVFRCNNEKTHSAGKAKLKKKQWRGMKPLRLGSNHFEIEAALVSNVARKMLV